MAKNAKFVDKKEPEQGELFVCDVTNWPVKDDMASMEFPLFSLAKQKDTKPREYRRGNKVVRIRPSADGAATVFDKDLLLYISSQIVAAKNEGRPVSRTVQLDSIDFLLGTGRGDGRASFERIIDMLRRLRGTTIETNIPTGEAKITQTEGFSMIDHYKVLSSKTRAAQIEDKKSGKKETVEVERVINFSVTLSEWLYNGLLNYEVLTLDRGYFRLTRAFDRRFYEIARKHCGDQAIFKIGIDLLAEKIGTARERFKVRDEIRTSIVADELPEYKLALDTRTTPDTVVFYTRDSAKLSQELMKTKSYDWFQSLQRSDNAASWHKKSSSKKPSTT